jgi:hypothetical protein
MNRIPGIQATKRAIKPMMASADMVMLEGNKKRISDGICESTGRIMYYSEAGRIYQENILLIYSTCVLAKAVVMPGSLNLSIFDRYFVLQRGAGKAGHWCDWMWEGRRCLRIGCSRQGWRGELSLDMGGSREMEHGQGGTTKLFH